MKLENIIKQTSIIQTSGSLSVSISALVSDSRKVVEGALYVALKGTVADGHQYIQTAINAGAKAIVCEALPENPQAEISYIVVENTQIALGKMAANFFGNPSEKLTLIGITGTNGKTSSASLLYHLFENLGQKAALFSTVENIIDGAVSPATHTTPDVLTLNQLLAAAVAKDCKFVVMEVSSHGIHQHRIEGLHFKIAGFTNITHDHLDYHHTFADYLATKKKFFDHLDADAVAITNIDDKNGKVMLQNTKATKKTYALKTIADYHGKVLETDFTGMLLNFNGKEFWTTLAGNFNAYNLLLAYAVITEAGFQQEEILKAMSQLQRVKGRFETFRSAGGIFFIVDYAHTPDALENILDSINQIRTRNERLITVFGCGGDRDHAKRPEMGKIATGKSTLAIITSDNPRNEDPQQIISEIEKGVAPQNFSKYTSVPNRREAIKMAIKFAEPKDIILVAGKGHENYQEISGVKHHFDDKETIIELAQMMSK